MNLKNKIAVVIGASRGIGRSIAEKLIIHGATVIGSATTELGVSVINKFLKNSGKGLKLDISNNLSIERFFKKIYTEYNNINIFINSAGIIKDNLCIRMNLNEWQSVINVNLTSIFFMSKIILPNMIKNHYGRIIFIGSIIGSIGNIGQVNYSASKSGLVGFSKSLAYEVASFGITVNVIAPGFISTDMINSLTYEQRIKILNKIPVNRLGNVTEIANVVNFFASEEASYVTGQTIHVNGGMYMP